MALAPNFVLLLAARLLLGLALGGFGAMATAMAAHLVPATTSAGRGVPTTVLSWGARSEPTRLEQIGGLIVMVGNVGIALGAVGGGVLVDAVSARTPLVAGGVAAVVGAAMLVTPRRRRPPSAPGTTSGDDRPDRPSAKEHP